MSLIKFSKKKLLNFILSKVYLFFNKKKIILFDAPYLFHLKHFKLIINELSKKNDIEVFVTGANPKDILPLVKFIPDINKFPLHRQLSLFITTEFFRPVPYWLEFNTVYFGHGIGPKLNYASSLGLKEFDFVFSPCKSVFDTQKSILAPNLPLKVGLPILEEPIINKEEIGKLTGLDLDKKSILYAPSWSDNIEMVSDISKILEFLQFQSVEFNLNLILSPHPNLFLPERCSGKVFFDSSYNLDGVYINQPNSPFSTLDLVKVTDITISDISSIFFEAMALDKLTIFDANRKLFEYSGSLHLYEQLCEICHVPNWDDKNDKTIFNAIEYDELMLKRQSFIRNYVYNLGNSKKVFIDCLYDIIEKKIIY